MSCLSYTALILWFLGHPDQALEKTREALTLIQELFHPYSQTLALNLAALLHKFRREEQATQEQAEAVMTLSTEQGFPLWSAQGAIQRGWALTEQGQGEEGIAQMQEGLDAWKATGAEVELPLFLAFLAEAYGKVGQEEKGLHVLTEALERVHRTGECFWEAELYRLKGELLLMKARRIELLSD